MTNKPLALGAFLLAGAVIGSVGIATAATPLTAGGMTVYVFDKDVGGVPSCYNECAVMWPPALAKTGAVAHTRWTTVKRTDGTMQWAYDNHPVYFYSKDKKKGDKLGDGVDGVWHVGMSK